MSVIRLLAGAAILLSACGEQSQATPSANVGIADASAEPSASPGAGTLPVNTANEAVVDTPATEMTNASAGESSDRSHATVVGALRTALVGAATLDGAPITDVTLRSRCTTAFVTAKGTTAIDWSKVGNFAGRIDGKQAVLPISDGGAEHLFAMPEGDAFRGVDGSMGLLADECGGPM
ncbi:hypothetical protein [Sphingomonas endolithica]|uniref:hypothetical protein n=1 Tax=Sphingomonas endolithica TaxID=2972485 RepID=UPI0021AFFAA8|nr:hypothetical protein [Sphingomonas sp. ZFBP2030]